jgi:hypothetical protein
MDRFELLPIPDSHQVRYSVRSHPAVLCEVWFIFRPTSHCGLMGSCWYWCQHKLHWRFLIGWQSCLLLRKIFRLGVQGATRCLVNFRGVIDFGVIRDCSTCSQQVSILKEDRGRKYPGCSQRSCGCKLIACPTKCGSLRS